MLDEAYPMVLLALTVWREARGEPHDAKRGVAWSIRNRTLRPGWWGTNYVSVITKAWQYTSMTGKGDPNLSKWPRTDDDLWIASQQAAEEAYLCAGTDPTGGAHSYFDDSLKMNPPEWALSSQFTFTIKLGALNFYRLVR